MAEDDEQPAEEAGGETEAASAWNILQSPAGKLVAAAGGGFVAYQCLRAASAIGDDARRAQRDLLEQTFTFGKKKLDEACEGFSLYGAFGLAPKKKPKAKAPAALSPAPRAAPRRRRPRRLAPAPAAAAPAPAPAAAAPAPAPAAAGDAEDAEDGSSSARRTGRSGARRSGGRRRSGKRKRKRRPPPRAGGAGDAAGSAQERREATPPPPRATTTTTTADEEAARRPAAEVDDADEPVAVDDPKKIISRDLLIAYDQENPKRPGTNSHFRYEAYKRATSGAAFLALGGTVADLRYDLGRGFVTSYDLDADAADDDGQRRRRCEPAAESGLYGRKRKQRRVLAECASVDNKLRRSATM
ncbi:hypothetical protein JL722_630 [Aureococcus anophagefferens]|nr:hypothetical protein JL722_630 [Aureococcus anophagefferens]